ncbi:DNA polymerase theta [Episyrphus balteatus]|uniref:DNA polymerase theta n=1 Tax=Episyrphus balteatus TaxID=286459 RepID=UPI0024861C43|nr:DNA polymerase theta [Episyrphus balteatus]
MAFSESFGLGNSTFMNLESEVNKALKVDSKNPPKPSPMDIIDESPTNSKIKPNNKSRSRHQVSSFGAQRLKKFHKSRSDSTLDQKPSTSNRLSRSKNDNNCSKDDNYSEFFKSEFSIEQSRVKPPDFVTTSQIEAAIVGNVDKDQNSPEAGFGFEESKMFSEILANFKTQQNEDANKSEVFDCPVFSDDIQDLLSDSNHSSKNDSLESKKNESLKISSLSDDDWKESLQFSEFQEDSPASPKKSTNLDKVEEIINIDDATFICPDDEGKELAEKTILDIKNEVQLALEEEKSISMRMGNISNISISEKSYVKVNSQLESDHLSGSIKLNPIKSPTKSNEQYEMKPDLEDLKRISAWNLPKSVLKEYEKKRISKMFDWQIECLSNPKVLFEHCNLVYSAPTSAGKTLVSEILLIKTILERGKKVIIILPFISVVREKMFYLQDLLIPSGYRVEGFFGGYTPPGGFDSINVAICTIEKANSIVNKLLEQGKLDEIGTVVVDEIHLISDPGRGYILELLLAKVLYMSRKFDLKIQIITMSATLANVELLKKWLDAELYITNYRPVALQEMIKIGTKIYNNNLEFIRELDTSEFKSLKDSDHVAQLCIETLSEGCSVVVFCPSKDWCENLSVQLAAAIHTIGRSGTDIGNKLRSNIKRDAIEEVKKQLKDIPTGLDSVLEKTINFACAYHHAGLTTEERDIIEACFKSGALKIIVATSTLSSGVNLPARRVIIRSPLFGGKQMSSLTYKQMIGRAGRTGKDTLGESILICTDSNARIGKDLVCAALNPISSCLEMESSTHLKRALLEVISSGVATQKSDIENFVSCTLLNTQKEISEKNAENDDVNTNRSFIFDSIDFLIEFEFIRLQHDEEKNVDSYVATRLGMACLASSMPPTDGLILFSELQKSRRCFVLESELHAVYLVTPYSVCYQLQELDWLMYLDLWEKLSPAMKKVGELVGVKESFLVRAMRGQTKLDYKLMQIHKRFYTALALQELVNETPVNTVAVKYKCNRGMLQSLQQMASTFAGIVTAFCNSLNWTMLALIVGQFKERLFFGVHRDLIDLMRLPDLNYKRARVLFDSGIQSLIDLANADVFTVEKVLHNSLSFDTAKKLENENDYENNQRNNIRNLYITGKAGLSVKDAAKMLVDEARQFVQYEIGGGNINWSQEKQNEDGNKNDGSSLERSKDNTNLKRKSTESSGNSSPPKIKKIDKDVQNGTSKALSREPSSSGIQNLGKNREKNEEKSKDQTDSRAERNPAKISSSSSGTSTRGIRSITKEKSSELIKQQNGRISPITNPIQKKVSTPLKKKREDHTKENRLPSEGTSVNPKANNAANSNHNNEIPVVSRTSTVECKTSKPLADNRVPTNHGKPEKPESKSNEQIPSYSNDKVKLIKANSKQEEKHSKPIEDPSIKNRINKEKLQPPPVIKVQEIKKKQNTVKSNIPPSVRRSPRNHLPSSTRIEKSHEKSATICHEDDLFMDDSSFEMNSAITNAMGDKKNDKPQRASLNKSSDEIAASQEETVFQPKTQSTRLLRSYRERPDQKTPTKRTPLRRKTEEDLKLSSPPGPSRQLSPPKQKEPQQTNKSNTLEVSDLSLGNSLMQNPIQLNSSHILSSSKVDPDALSLNCIQIVDICGSVMLFKNAIKELMEAKTIGFSIGLEKQQSKQKPLIGSNLLINQIGSKENNKNNREAEMDFQVDDSSYVSGVSMVISENFAFYLNLQIENTGKGVTKDMKIEAVREFCKNSELTLQIFDAKEQLKVLKQIMPDIDEIQCKIEDPKVANWLLQPDHMMSMVNLAQQFAPECKAFVKLTGSSRGYNSIGLDLSSAIFGKIRSSIEACVTMHILKGQIENLQRIGTGQLHKFFIELEMPLQMSLCEMEIYGFPTNESHLRKLFQQMMDTMKKLETKIYETHGSKFNLGSASAVARVVGLHRKANGRISTSKQILEKIDSPIAQMIVIYRKLSVTVTKTIQPLLRCIVDNRIRSNSITFTSTGRISMQEPNLQNVAKDFEVTIGSSEKIKISCRSSFSPPNGRCLVSADFCQLEMRILAHLSQDPPLLQVMNSEKDVFTAIAAKWNKVTENSVSEELRNGTKQICYGIVYGMGMRALAESLKCNEQEARTVSEQFHAAYPGIRQYTEKVMKYARQHGYVETITGRRRYLENINSGESQLKSQAERQAVNSTIQGSAADIAKSAILRMKKNIAKYREKIGLTSRCVNLVLHLHDELIFEVPEDKAKKVAKVLSITMENCVRLSVPLKVKLKIGKSWGDLREVKL